MINNGPVALLRFLCHVSKGDLLVAVAHDNSQRGVEQVLPSPRTFAGRRHRAFVDHNLQDFIPLTPMAYGVDDTSSGPTSQGER